MIVGKLMVVLGLDSTGFNTGISSATGKTTAFAKLTDKTFKLISKSAKIGLLAVSAAFIKGTIDAAKFEKSLANVATMLDKKTLPMMTTFEKALLSMSEEFGESTSTLADGLYDILSASIPASKALDVLEVSAMAAQAGLTDTGVAADAITTLMNSFGDATKDAQFWSDILFVTVKLGKTTFAELAPVIGNVAKLMEVAGGTGKEMAAMLAIMTRNGIQTRVAVTSLKGVVSALIKPSEELTEELGGMTVKADGFRAVMDKIGSLPVTDLAAMFPNVRALTGVVVAAKDLGTELVKIDDIFAEGSPSLAAFEIQTDTLAFTWNQFKKTLTATSITIGNELLPTINAVLKDTITWLQENREEFASFARITLAGIKDILNFMFKFKEVLLGLGTAILGLMALGKVTALMTSFGIATSVSLGPVAAIAFAIGGLVAVFFKLRSEMKALEDQEKLLEDARFGALKTSEDYNKALELQVDKINEAKEANERRTNADLTRMRISAEQNQMAIARGEELIAQEEAILDQIIENMAAKKRKDEAEKKRAEEKENADLKAFYADQDRLSEIARLEAESAAIKRQLDAEEEAATEAQIAQMEELDRRIFLLKQTEEEAIEAQRLIYEGLGKSYEEIMLLLKDDFPKAFEEVEEASSKAFGNMGDVQDKFWIESARGLAGYKEELEKNTEEVIPTFVDKWTDAVNAVKEVFTQMYSALTGVTDQYFANKFSKLNNEIAAEESVNKKAGKIERERIQKLLDDEVISEEKAKELLKVLEDQEYENEKAIAEKRYKLELKQFKVTKALNIAEAAMNIATAITKAIPNFILMAIIGGLGAVQVGLIASQEPPPAPSFIRGGAVDDLVNSGVFSGKPGIDTNQINVTSGEYIMPPQQTADNLEELEAMRTGSGGRSITVNPMPFNLELEGRTFYKGIIEFMTEGSDRGEFRINPKVIGALT